MLAKREGTLLAFHYQSQLKIVESIPLRSYNFSLSKCSLQHFLLKLDNTYPHCTGMKEHERFILGVLPHESGWATGSRSMRSGCARCMAAQNNRLRFCIVPNSRFSSLLQIIRRHFLLPTVVIYLDWPSIVYRVTLMQVETSLSLSLSLLQLRSRSTFRIFQSLVVRFY